jgi:hypothetical protein
MQVHLRRLLPSRWTNSLAVVLAMMVVFSAPAIAAPVWEYRVENSRVKPRVLFDMLNAAGREGWELVLITENGMAVFKRRK